MRVINKKRVICTACFGALAISNVMLVKKLNKNESINELLNMENQFLHYVITGLSNPDVVGSEFQAEIGRRANFINLVSQL